MWSLWHWLALSQWNLTLLKLKLFLASLKMNLKASRAKFPPTYVTHESFWPDHYIWALVLLLLAFEAHYLVSHKCIRVKGSTAPGTRLQRLVIVVVESSLIIVVNSASCDLATQHLVEVRRCFWAGSTLMFWLLLLIHVPLLFTCFDVNLQTLSAVLSPTNVAHEHSRSQGSGRFLNRIS